MRSGNSSRILEMSKVPIPAPVPPPREWVIWKPWRQSVPSASLRTTSMTESTSSAPCAKTQPTMSVRLFSQIDRRDAPQCSGPWPSCCRRQTGQRQSCRGGRAGRRDQSGRSPWCLAPSRRGQREAHTSDRRLHCSRPAVMEVKRGCVLVRWAGWVFVEGPSID